MRHLQNVKGSRPMSRRSHYTAPEPRDRNLDRQVFVFPSELGWFGILGENGALLRLTFGHSSAGEAREALISKSVEGDEQVIARDGAHGGGGWPGLERSETPESAPISESDWHPELRDRLTRYARGERVAFDDVELSLPPLTSFQ